MTKCYVIWIGLDIVYANQRTLSNLFGNFRNRLACKYFVDQLELVLLVALNGQIFANVSFYMERHSINLVFQ